MEKLQRCVSFLIPISFTVIYGALFAKSWRVFLVFKNLNFNGKLTRDEHLLLGVLIMILIDLAILLPWILADPIQCKRQVVRIEEERDELVILEIDECRSKYQPVWLSLLYFYKFVMVTAGLYFTWQTRHVTLPSLRDSKQTYFVTFTIVSCALVTLPSLLVPSVGMRIRFASGGLAMWIVLTTTLTLLFMPKMLLARQSRAASENASSLNFLFSESMRKTQEAIRKCSLCFCCGATEADRYGQEMLASEIDALKRTIKQKDTTIRELNDRLYIGTEKFQEYLTSPTKHNQHILAAMREKHYAGREQTTEEQQCDDEGIHSSESYQYSSEEPGSLKLSIASNNISTVSSQHNGHVSHSEFVETDRVRSNSHWRSSFSVKPSVRSYTAHDSYIGEPWKPPHCDATLEHNGNDLPRRALAKEVIFRQSETPAAAESADAWRQSDACALSRLQTAQRSSARSQRERSEHSLHQYYQSPQFSQIDLRAMEHDAMTSANSEGYVGKELSAHNVYHTNRNLVMPSSHI